MVAIRTKYIPIKAHWSIKKVKQSYITLLYAYKIIQKEIGLDILKEAYLQMAVKALNNFIGPNSLVPTLLVFSTFL